MWSVVVSKVGTLNRKGSAIRLTCFCVIAITYWLTEILGRQKRNDFKPRDEEVVMMSNGTTVRDST